MANSVKTCTIILQSRQSQHQCLRKLWHKNTKIRRIYRMKQICSKIAAEWLTKVFMRQKSTNSSIGRKGSPWMNLYIFRSCLSKPGEKHILMFHKVTRISTLIMTFKTGRQMCYQFFYRTILTRWKQKTCKWWRKLRQLKI